MNPTLEIRDRHNLLRSRHKPRVPKPAQSVMQEASVSSLVLPFPPRAPSTDTRFDSYVAFSRAFTRSTRKTNTHRSSQAASYK